ncbi:MAG: helix-turn-helix domain-containing protein [Candidatus Omnitrophota bacterium]
MSRKPKIPPKIARFVLDARRRNVDYGVRQLAELVHIKFNLKVSKSSINNLIKKAHLSRPVGRGVLRTNRYSGDAYGVGYGFMLGALRLYGICERLAGIIKKEGCSEEKMESLVSLVESLVMAKAIFNVALPKILEYSKEDLWNLLGYKISKGNIQRFYANFKFSQTIGIKLVTEYLISIKDVHHARIQLADGSFIYLDGSLQAAWPNAKIPIEFSTNSLFTDRYIDSAIDGNEIFMVFNTADLNALGKEFSDLVYGLDGSIASKRIRKIGFFKPSGELVKEIPLVLPQRRRFVIGAWPSQFKAITDVEKQKPCASLHFEPLGQIFYISEGLLKYSQHIDNKEVILRLIVLKSAETSGAKIALFTNADEKDWSPADIAEAFLRRFGDFQQKHHFFVQKLQNPGYVEDFMSFDSISSFSLRLKEKSDFDGFLGQIVEISDLLAKNTFFPTFCYKWSLLKTRELIYKQPGSLKRDLANDSVFNLLEYNELGQKEAYESACVKFNESLVFEKSGRKIWFRCRT